MDQNLLIFEFVSIVDAVPEHDQQRFDGPFFLCCCWRIEKTPNEPMIENMMIPNVILRGIYQ